MAPENNAARSDPTPPLGGAIRRRKPDGAYDVFVHVGNSVASGDQAPRSVLAAEHAELESTREREREETARAEGARAAGEFVARNADAIAKKDRALEQHPPEKMRSSNVDAPGSASASAPPKIRRRRTPRARAHSTAGWIHAKDAIEKYGTQRRHCTASRRSKMPWNRALTPRTLRVVNSCSRCPRSRLFCDGRGGSAPSRLKRPIASTRVQNGPGNSDGLTVYLLHRHDYPHDPRRLPPLTTDGTSPSPHPAATRRTITPAPSFRSVVPLER